MQLKQITIIRLDYNFNSRFIFKLLGIELQGESHGFDGSFFGIYFGGKYFYIDIFFFEIRIKSPFL